jgi:26S proteasome regulatory subunit N2
MSCLAKAIDRYIKARAIEEKIDPQLQITIEGIFQRCILEGEYRQVRCSESR